MSFPRINEYYPEHLPRWITDISDFVKLHEKLIIALSSLVVLAVLFYGGIAALATHDKNIASQAEAQRQAQSAQNEKQAAVDLQMALANAQLLAEYKALAVQVSAQNQQLENTNATLAALLKKQQAQDASLSYPALANRVEALSEIPTGTITTAGNNFTVPYSGFLKIATTLEAGPVLQKQLDNVRQEKANTDKQLAKQTVFVDGLTNQISGLNTEISGLKQEIHDADGACKAQITAVKAEARKSKFKWFGAGYIAGLASRGIITIFTGK